MTDSEITITVLKEYALSYDIADFINPDSPNNSFCRGKICGMCCVLKLCDTLYATHGNVQLGLTSTEKIQFKKDNPELFV